MLTLEFIDQEIASLMQQRDNFFSLYHQATGAIQSCEAMKKKLLEEPANETSDSNPIVS